MAHSLIDCYSIRVVQIVSIVYCRIKKMSNKKASTLDQWFKKKSTEENPTEMDIEIPTVSHQIGKKEIIYKIILPKETYPIF